VNKTDLLNVFCSLFYDTRFNLWPDFGLGLDVNILLIRVSILAHRFFEVRQVSGLNLGLARCGSD